MQFEYKRTFGEAPSYQPNPPDDQDWELVFVKEGDDWVSYYWRRDLTVGS